MKNKIRLNEAQYDKVRGQLNEALEEVRGQVERTRSSLSSLATRSACEYRKRHSGQGDTAPKSANE